MKRFGFFALTVILAAVFVGCAGITRLDYDQVRVGQSTAEHVQRILGDPWAGAGSDLWLYIPQRDRSVRIEIEFGPEGLVSSKRWRERVPADGRAN